MKTVHHRSPPGQHHRSQRWKRAASNRPPHNGGSCGRVTRHTNVDQTSNGRFPTNELETLKFPQRHFLVGNLKKDQVIWVTANSSHRFQNMQSPRAALRNKKSKIVGIIQAGCSVVPRRPFFGHRYATRATTLGTSLGTISEIDSAAYVQCITIGGGVK